MTKQATTIDELAFTGPYGEQGKQILTAEAVEFLAELVTHLTPQRSKLLIACIQQQQDADSRMLPDFISETVSIRYVDWKIRGIPSNLEGRRVEIIGSVKRKMVINAFNASVRVSMADFEDSLTPDQNKVIDGQINLRNAANGTISYSSEAGKVYQLKPNPAVLIYRIRGLHLPEKHVAWCGETTPGSLLNFAFHFFHNYQALLVKDNGPCLYLPRTQSWQEAAWWSEVFSYVEDCFNLPRGTIKATLLIEALLVMLQMDEILHALRDHIVGLDCGRRDYIFSYIRILENYPDRALPDRQAVTMDKPFLSACLHLLTRTCHKCGAFTMGDMAASIPNKDEERNNQALDKVKADRSLGANNGYGDTWIIRPGLADTTMAVLNDILGSRKNQFEVTREQDAPTTTDQLLAPRTGGRTEEGMRASVRVAAQHIEVWISGNGCVLIYGLMENAAMAEISYISIWQQIHHQKTLSNGKPVIKALLRRMLGRGMKVTASELGEERFSHGRLDDAVRLMEQVTISNELIDFLTLPGHRLLAQTTT